MNLIYLRTRSTYVGLLVILACADKPASESQQSPSNESQRDSISNQGTLSTEPADPYGPAASMTAFRSAFDSAGFPQKAGLPGEWWMIQMVSAPSRMPELIEFDPSGYKRDDIDGRPLEWRLVFGTESTGELTLTSYHPYDPKELQDEVRFAENGELWFTTEFGGDSRITYRCRERRQNRLICLMRGAEDYDGREFLKVR